MKARVAASQMVRIGLLKRLSTWWKKDGIPRSRACETSASVTYRIALGHLPKANIILLLLVMLNSPQCHTQMIIKVNKAIAPSSPKTSRSICNTGWPVGVPAVRSKSCIENRRHKIRNHPKIDEKMMEERTPIGALHDAFRVSSDRCALASKPVMVYWLIKIPIHATYVGEALSDQPGSPVPSLNLPTIL